MGSSTAIEHSVTVGWGNGLARHGDPSRQEPQSRDLRPWQWQQPLLLSQSVCGSSAGRGRVGHAAV